MLVKSNKLFFIFFRVVMFIVLTSTIVYYVNDFVNKYKLRFVSINAIFFHLFLRTTLVYGVGLPDYIVLIVFLSLLIIGVAIINSILEKLTIISLILFLIFILTNIPFIDSFKMGL